MTVKVCTQCHEEKPVEEFRLGGVATNGKRYLASDCNDCHRASSRAYRTANLDARRAAELAYSRANAERKRESARRWYTANPERGKANSRRRYAEKPGEVVADAMVQRARKANAPVIERFTRDEIILRDQGRCQVCGEAVNPSLPQYHPESLNLDHVVPLSGGGAHTRANIRVTHQRCNLARRRSKSAILTA